MTMGSPERPVPDSSNVIFPRRKQGQHKKHGRKEGVVVTMEILETVFHLPLHKACKDLVSCPRAICIALMPFALRDHIPPDSSNFVWPLPDGAKLAHPALRSVLMELHHCRGFVQRR